MMRRSRGRPQPAESTVSIVVSSLTVGAQAANSFTGWDSPANTVTQNSFWGASNTKYLTPGNSAFFIAKSQGRSRDQEVSTWMQRGTIYLRLTDTGKALAFTAAPQTALYSVSVVSGITEGTGTDAKGPTSTLVTNLFITTLPVLETVPGYSKDVNAGHYWTFGCEGFDIYLKYNGVEFWRTTQFYHLEPGKIAFGAQASHGFRDISATFKVSTALYSDITTKTFDLRDFGMASMSAVGTIGANSTTLTLVSNPGFEVGQKIVIATGGEAGGGIPGEQGVGGSWPTLKYATVAAMNADTTQVRDKVCGVLATGDVYQWNGTAWVSYYYNISSYLTRILPKAHSATITAVAGTTLTLSTPTVAPSTSATVYRDNAPELLASFNNLVSGLTQQTGCTISIPSGDNWVFVNTNISIASVNGVRVRGAGVENTTIVYPTGTLGSAIQLFQCGSAAVSDINFVGNCRSDKGYYFAFNATNDVFGGALDNIRITACPGSVVERINSLNHSTSAVLFAFVDGGTIQNINVVHETGHKQYFQWAVAMSDSGDCTIQDITYDCPHMMAGLETFRSIRSTLRRATGRNTILSTNSSQAFLIEDCSIYYETGCAEMTQPGMAGFPYYPSINEPLVSLNSNVDNTSGSATGSGGTIRNCNFDVRGQLWAGLGVNIINISGSVTNILIEGKYPDKPVSGPSGLFRIANMGSSGRALALRCDSQSVAVTVDGCRVISDNLLSPFGNLGGNPTAGMTIQNCVVDNQNTSLGTLINNITNAAYEAL